MDAVFRHGDNFRGYTIERLLGKGGLGAVYLARHEMMDRLYAIKILYPHIATDKPEYVRRFVREARIASKLNHPNVVSVFDVGYDEPAGVYFLVMEYVDGSDLRTALAFGGTMEPNETVRIVASVAKALAVGEPLGVVHRDIKPENIMLERDGTVKLVDLGVAKARDADSLRTMPKTVFGTPNYISPEQAQDSSRVDARADVYSLGVVLFEMLCGKRPYNCEKPKEVIALLLSQEKLPDIRTFKPDVPAKLAELIGLMLAKNPEERLSGASALLAKLVELGYGEIVGDVSGKSVHGNAPYAPSVSQATEFSYAKLLKTEANDTLSFETKDEEIKSFVNSVKARKRRESMARYAVPITALAIAVVLFAIALARFLMR